jgi:uncharacterized LabA/DUF88 family protein
MLEHGWASPVCQNGLDLCTFERKITGMIKHVDQRVGVFVDVQNLYYSARNLYQSRVNFQEILNRAVNDRKLIRALAYVISADNSEENKFFDVLYHLGYEVRMKELQTWWGGKTKGDWDVGMTIDCVKMAEKLDVFVLITGDGDYVPLVEYLQFRGSVVEVIGFGRTTSSKLIDVADSFLDLDAISESILFTKIERQPVDVHDEENE